ncbi:MAG: hypothetical protein JNL67_12540 [Planctomycetaceae bacterium]|nr:hypothetical protein [Planctomycetaceae bacterium]
MPQSALAPTCKAVEHHYTTVLGYGVGQLGVRLILKTRDLIRPTLSNAQRLLSDRGVVDAITCSQRGAVHDFTAYVIVVHDLTAYVFTPSFLCPCDTLRPTET